MFEDRIEAAIDLLTIALSDYRKSEYEMSVESIDTALHFANDGRTMLKKTIVDIQTQAEKE